MQRAEEPWDEEDEPITLGADDESDERNLGPDERDMDLLDGSWEQEYYAGRLKSVDWRTVGVGLALLLLVALTVPALLVLFN